MRPPFFSIITASFNSEKTIERTLQSVLSQSCMEYEYIIVDGCSTDRTVELIKKYEPLFNGRLKWISEEDEGIYDAFNKGILRTIGKYTWIVNSDDYIEPDALSSLHQMLKDYDDKNLPLVCCKLNMINPDGSTHICFYNSKISKKRAQEFEMGILHPATLIPRTMYEIVGLYDKSFRINADLDWFLRYNKYDLNAIFPDIVVSNMTWGGISTATKFSVKMKSRWKLYQKHCPNFFVLMSSMRLWMWRRFKDQVKSLIK